jgi:hypothetical protein
MPKPLARIVDIIEYIIVVEMKLMVQFSFWLPPMY